MFEGNGLQERYTLIIGEKIKYWWKLVFLWWVLQGIVGWVLGSLDLFEVSVFQKVWDWGLENYKFLEKVNIFKIILAIFRIISMSIIYFLEFCLNLVLNLFNIFVFYVCLNECMKSKYKEVLCMFNFLF